MHEIGRRLLSRFAAAWAPVLLFTSPFVLREAMTASVDLALAFFFLGGVLGLLEYRENPLLLFVDLFRKKLISKSGSSQAWAISPRNTTSVMDSQNVMLPPVTCREG